MMIQRGSPPGTSPAPCLHRATVSPSPLINIHHLVLVTLLAGASIGCDPHVDPVCLGPVCLDPVSLGPVWLEAVSYTHLTVPTIYCV